VAGDQARGRGRIGRQALQLRQRGCLFLVGIGREEGREDLPVSRIVLTL
jgi:hypothetical protein